MKAVFYLVILFFVVQCTNDATIKDIKQKITPLEHSWDYAVPHQEIPEGLTSLSAESCGACHKDHYDEWKYSTHSHAWTDLQFQAELKKETSPFMCINCHIPLQNQQEYIIKGLIDGDIYKPVKVKNPHFDKALQQEGINCASCHVRNGAVVGPTGTSLAPHKTVKDTLHLSEKLCISCHNAVAVVTPTLACTFETGDEWKAGPFYDKKNCISCHMDTITRSIVPGFDKRLSHRHFFAGSGIPKFADVETKMLTGLTFTLESPPTIINKGGSLKLSFNVKNEFAGHKIPTGDPERFIKFEFLIIDELNNMVFTQIERIGEKWEWYPKANKLGDNNLLPGEEREYKIEEKMETLGTYKVQIIVTKHRASQEAADYNKLGDEYPLFIEIYNKEIEFVVK